MGASSNGIAKVKSKRPATPDPNVRTLTKKSRGQAASLSISTTGNLAKTSQAAEPGGIIEESIHVDGQTTSLSSANQTCTTQPSSGEELLQKACAHLISVEPKLEPLIRKHPCPLFSSAGLSEEIDPFRSLVTSILGQQLSGAATKAIKAKLIGLYANEPDVDSTFPTPARVAGTEINRLRSAGLSKRKAEYVQGLAAKFTFGELSNEMLLDADDDEVMEKLTAVRGLGQWSVEMFAVFALKRIDVFSTGDLGIQKGMAAFLGKDVRKLRAGGGGKWKYLSKQEMLEGSEKFKPYRSVFMWYMWRFGNVDAEALEVKI